MNIHDWPYKWFGFFRVSDADPDFVPDASDFFDKSWERDTKQKVSEYLNKAPKVLFSASGRLPCKFCGEVLQMGIFQSDGVWLWPEDLSHYVEKHDVRVPLSFEHHILNTGMVFPSPKNIDLKNLPWPVVNG